MSLEWECTFCLGRGYNPETIGDAVCGTCASGGNMNEPMWEWINVRCKKCRGTGKLPYRKENKVLWKRNDR